MRWTCRVIVSFVLLIGAPCTPADEPAPDPMREVEELDARAAKAEEAQDFEAALDLRRKAVSLLRERRPESSDLARSLVWVAHTLEALGRAVEALPLYEESLAIERRHHAGDDPQVALGLEHLALVLESLGRATEALALEQEALAMTRRLHPGDHPNVATSLDTLALVLLSLGRATEALPLREESLAMRRRLFPGDGVDVATGLANFGLTLDELGRSAEALQLIEESLAMFRRLHPGDHPDVAEMLASLARTLVSLGRATEALPRMEESLAMRRRLHPGDHPDVARGLNDLGRTLVEVGQVAESLPILEESLAMWRRLHPGDHPNVASSLNNLAVTLDELGRAGQALRLYQESLAMRRRLYPGDHPDVATSLNNVGAALAALGRWGEMLPLEEESLAMHRRLYPGDHPAVATCLANLARGLAALGREADGLPLQEEELSMRRRLFQGDHPDVATSLGSYGNALESVGRTVEALPFEEEALAMCRRLYRRDHPNLATGLDSLASTLRSLGRPAEALPLYEEALAMRRRLFAGDHPYVAGSLSNLALTLSSLGRTAEALPRLEESLAMLRRLYPGDHPYVATALNNVAFALDALNRTAEAVPLYEESLAMTRRLFPGDHPGVALHLDNLGAALELVGRVSEALPLKEESLAMRRRIYGGDHPDVAAGLNNLAHTLRLLGRRTEALPHREEAYAMARRLSSPDRWKWGTELGADLLEADRPRDAVEPLRTAVETLEALRSDARGLRPDERSRFVESMREWDDPYAGLARAYVALGEPALALEVVERGRGREMFDLLLRGRTDSLAAARAAARERGDERAERELESAEADRASREVDVVRRERETAKARDRMASRDEIRARLDAESQARKSLLEVMSKIQRLERDCLPAAKSLAAEEAQALLGRDERLLVYSFSGSASYVFVVSHDVVEVAEVPTMAAAEGAIAYADVLSRGGSDLAIEVLPKGRALFRTIVPESVWNAVKGAARIYVMAESPLDRVPLETLVVDEKEGRPVYWAEAGPPIAYEPSASVLAWLRGRPTSDSFGADLVAVGDPIFAGTGSPIAWPEKGVLVTEVRPGGQAERLGLRPGDVIVRYDEREIVDPPGLREAIGAAGEGRGDVPVGLVRGGQPREVAASSGLLGVGVAMEPPPVAGPILLAGGPLSVALRAAEERGRGLARLPGTRAEVSAIEATLRKRLGERAKTTVLLGAEATEARLLDATRSPRLLHLATHGLVDETETASFSSLALTMPAVPVAGDDGFLTLVDLFSRWRGRLDGTELVVLSACESTKGRQRVGESMYALPWGFLYAGARAVVGSLWKVDDEATALLMTEFYERLLAADGKDALAALAAARLATMAKYPHPNRWGAFVFSGAP